VRQARFDFVIIGPRTPSRVLNPNTHEQTPLWNATFVVTTSAGEKSHAFLGGVAGAGGELLSYPRQPPVHPCAKRSPNY
jgi:hypothetical protein